MIPQTQSWQVVLRDWIASKLAADFDISLSGLTYDASYFSGDDDIYRVWASFENVGRGVASNNGIRIPASCYTLAEIEKPDGVYMSVVDRVEPASMAWVYSWDYAGNPHYQQATLANRALCAAAVDMMMSAGASIDQDYYGYFSQSYASGFATWAYVFSVCGSHLPPSVSTAFAEGLDSFYEAFQVVGPTDIQADMDLPAMIGMHYYAPNDPRTEAYARAYFVDGGTFTENGQSVTKGPYYHAAGYVDHGDGFDPTYNGISIKYLTWLANRTGWDFCTDALNQMYVLKKHLSIPDGGSWYGPSHFATATDAGSPRDQHWTFGREVAASYVAPAAMYLHHGFRDVPYWLTPIGIKDAAAMLADIQDFTNKANSIYYGDQLFGTWTRESTDTPLKWVTPKHMAIPNLVWDYYEDGFYAQVLASGDGLPGEHITQHGEDFVTFKIGGFGGVIHIGGLCKYPDRANGGLCGLSGGGISAIYTDKGGIGILGRTRGSQDRATPDTWENIDSWAVNHVWGRIAENLVSTARYKGDKRVQCVIDRENVLVKTHAKLVDFSGTELMGLDRVMDITGERTEVTVTPGGQHMAYSELYETLPLWMGDGYAADDDNFSPIHFLFDGVWNLLQDSEQVTAADAVKIESYGHVLLIDFDGTYNVHLGPIWQSTYQRENERIIPIHIDIMETGSIRYTISGPYTQILQKVQ